jgi:hypothetical protein
VQCILRHQSHCPADCLRSGCPVLCCIRHQARLGRQLLGQQNSSCRRSCPVLRLRGCRVMYIAMDKSAGAARNIGCERTQTINILSVNSWRDINRFNSDTASSLLPILARPNNEFSWRESRGAVHNACATPRPSSGM